MDSRKAEQRFSARELEVQLSFSAPFGVVLRALRKGKGWTQLRLAVELHRDHTYISKWEKGTMRPDPDDLTRLTLALPLTCDEQALLRNAWLRSEADKFDTDETGEHLLTSLRAAATLRRLGQPRIGYELAARDARVALERARTIRTTDVQLQEILTLAGDLLLEEVKGALDFATKGQVRDGLLATNAREHRLVCNALDNHRAKVKLALASEAVHYAAGEIGKAHEGAQLLYDELTVRDPEWLAEVIRAEAINSGLLGDSHALRQAWERFHHVQADLSDDLRHFVLEGFVRGFTEERPDKAFDIVASVYEAFEAIGCASPVRWVQVVRAEGRLLSSVSGILGNGDTQRRVETALATSKSLELSKYIVELEAILASAY